MVELDELANRAVADPVARPRPMADLEHGAQRRRQRRQHRIAGGLAAALAVLVVGVGTVAGVLDSDTRSDVIATGPAGGDEGNRWGGGVRVIVFLDHDLTDVQIDEVEQLIDSHPDVAEWSFMDMEESAAEFRRTFEDNDAMLRWLDANSDGVPTRFRIVPADIDQKSRRALIDRLEKTLGVFQVSWDPGWLDADDVDDATVDLNTLLDRPATPEDKLPDDFGRQWDWEPYQTDFELDVEASRQIAFSDDTPFYAVPTERRDGVCFLLAIDPPDWFPDVDSVQPVVCADAESFNRSGLTLRVCGPDDQWITGALVPIGLASEEVEPFGTLHPSGAAILYDETGPESPVHLEYAPGKDVTLEGAPVGTQPEDGSVPC